MIENDKLYTTNDKEEIFWITTSFFAKSFIEQKNLINFFSLTKFPSDFNGSIQSEILSVLGWCYRTYFPDFEKDLYQIAIELYALLELIENHSFGIKREGLGEQRLLTFYSMGNEEIWNLVRRLSNLILHAWGKDPYKFKSKIDLDYIGPEVF